MRTKLLTLLALAGFGATAFAAVLQEEINIKLGPKAFRDGDAIRIDAVRSTSPKLEQGDTVTVTGRYRLDSRKSARLLLLLTQVEGEGREETDPSQMIDAIRGWHPFEATITVKHRGFLHLTFYDEQSGKPFGGVYFGAKSEMRHADQISVGHYTAED